MKKFLLVFYFMLAALYSGASEKEMTRQEYIERFAPIAMEEMQRSKVPASITLAQGCLESGNANSRLAKKGNNHFGIKCHKSWTGKTMSHDDDKKGECFRVYKHAEESYKDHSDFLVNGSRYASLFELKPDDYAGWAKGLRKAGYATDPKYPDKLIRIIEESGLNKYDEMVLSGKMLLGTLPTPNETKSKPEKPERVKKERYPKKTKYSSPASEKPSSSSSPSAPVLADVDNFSFDSPVREVFDNNRCRYVVVQKGDTYTSLAEQYALLEWQLRSFNDLAKDHQLVTGQIIYLQSKKNNADKKYNSHTVKTGETLHRVSQLYAIKIGKLRKYNALTTDDVSEGQVIRLRK